MLLRVGPFVYRVEKVAGYVQHEGEDCLGLCDNDEHVLWLSERCSTAQQIQVLCHEYMEAWLYHFGQGVSDKEDWCDLFGLAMTQFVMDLMQTLRLEGPAILGGPSSDTNVNNGAGNPDRDVAPKPSGAGEAGEVSGRQPKRARRSRVPIRTLEGRFVPDGSAESDAGRAKAIRDWREQVMQTLSRAYRDAGSSS
ncbi:MAG: hypothetical protein AAF911_14660 [Planctomycetota bacterium]